MAVERIAVSLPSELLREFDAEARKRAYSNRSKAVSDALTRYLSEMRARGGKGSVVGTITLLYDHHTRGTVDRLTETQHAFSSIISSSVHAHISHRTCLEVIVVRGDSRKLEKLADALISSRGVSYGKLVCASPGKW